MKPWRTGAVLAAAAGLAALAGAAPAYAGGAATITFPGGGSEMYYVAGADQVNQVVITAVPGGYAVDDVVPISFTDESCRYPDPADSTAVQCVRPISIVDVDAGNLSDTVDNRAGVSSRVNGGDGNDTLVLGPPGLIVGGSGFRHVAGGGAGNDRIVATTRTRDWLIGGRDFDTISYAGRTAPLTVNLAASTGGEGGESDGLFEFEAIEGGAAADALTGTDDKNWIWGRDGNDRIAGGRGPDTLLGEIGRDTILGGPDNDALRGGPGVDTLDGGTEFDACYAGADGAWLVPGTCEHVA